MPSKVPFVRSDVSWNAVCIKLGLLLALNLLFYCFDERTFYLYASFAYVILSYAVRAIVIPNQHRKGINLLKQEKFEEALPYFEECVAFFTRHAWVDKYRALTMFLSSKRTFREISLCNAAFCMLQSGKVGEAKQTYENVLKDYPENTIARSALLTISSLTSYSPGT
jgi:tetratricopeptide (TPR) repeat protein